MDYFADLLVEGIAVYQVGLDLADATVAPFASPRRPGRIVRASYRRSAVGGLGTLVSEPSSGGSG